VNVPKAKVGGWKKGDDADLKRAKKKDNRVRVKLFVNISCTFSDPFCIPFFIALSPFFLRCLLKNRFDFGRKLAQKLDKQNQMEKFVRLLPRDRNTEDERGCASRP